MENQDSPAFSDEFWAKALNNSPWYSATVQVLAFAINGSKNNIYNDSFVLGPRVSGFRVADVSGTVQYEVQMKVTGKTPQYVLIGGFGELEGSLVPAHRLVHSEWAKIPCALFGPIAPPTPE
jgi:hypothetical protein